MSAQPVAPLRKAVDLAYPVAVARAREALAAEGFGVLTEVDVSATLKKKLGADFRSYIILGACHPPSAKQVLEADPEFGLYLPCNVIVYSDGEARSVVSAFDPVMVAGDAPAPIADVARDIRQRLERVVAAV
jgi:uncharacterized protein (DUF302 family)